MLPTIQTKYRQRIFRKRKHKHTTLDENLRLYISEKRVEAPEKADKTA
jgi:hypothetical protein